MIRVFPNREFPKRPITQNTNDLKLTDQLERELIEREMSEGIYYYRRPNGQSFSFAPFFTAIANLFRAPSTAKA
jgi:hypothetical protein